VRWLTRLLGPERSESLELAEPARGATAGAERSLPSLRSLLAGWLGASRGVAIDLGTTHTRVSRGSRGEVTSDASVVALRLAAHGQQHVLAVGNAARHMLGRTPPSIRVVRPFQGGALADVQATELLIRHLIRGAQPRRSFMRPSVVLAVPTGITAVERRALCEATVAAGARDVHLIPVPMAAALGSGLPVGEPRASMIVDIGGGTTDVAVLALNGIVRAGSIRVGGDTLDQAIRATVQRKFALSIGAEAAEQIKIAIGCVWPDDVPRSLLVKGSDFLSRQPRSVELRSEDVSDALAEPVAAILRATHAVLEAIPPELAADLVDTGIWLTGGGSLLTGLDTLLATSTQLPVRWSPEPFASVALGCRRCLEDPELLAQVETR